MLKSMLQSRLRAFLEGTMQEFTAPLDSGRLERAKKLQYHYAGIERNLSGDAVIKWHIPSQSNPGTMYECYVSIRPRGMSLFAVANNVRDLRSRVNALKEADVRCFCPCMTGSRKGMATPVPTSRLTFAIRHANIRYASISLPRSRACFSMPAQS